VNAAAREAEPRSTAVQTSAALPSTMTPPPPAQQSAIKTLLPSGTSNGKPLRIESGGASETKRDAAEATRASASEDGELQESVYAEGLADMLSEYQYNKEEKAPAADTQTVRVPMSAGLSFVDLDIDDDSDDNVEFAGDAIEYLDNRMGGDSRVTLAPIREHVEIVPPTSTTGLALKLDGDETDLESGSDASAATEAKWSGVKNFDMGGLLGTMLPLGSLTRGIFSPMAGIKGVSVSSQPRSPSREIPEEPPSPVDKYVSKATTSGSVLALKSALILQDAASLKPIVLSSMDAIEQNDGSRPCKVKLLQLGARDGDVTKLVCMFLNGRGQHLLGIDLTACDIRLLGAQALAEALSHGTSLNSLNLNGNGLGFDGAMAIVKTLQANKITELGLGWNDIGLRGAKAVAEYIKSTTVLELGLEGNNIGDGGAKAIAVALSETSLVTLDLCENKLGNDACASLASHLPGSSLRSLKLAENNIGKLQVAIQF